MRSVSVTPHITRRVLFRALDNNSHLRDRGGIAAGASSAGGRGSAMPAEDCLSPQRMIPQRSHHPVFHSTRSVHTSPSFTAPAAFTPAHHSQHPQRSHHPVFHSTRSNSIRLMRSLFARLVAHTQQHWHARCLTCGLRFPYPGIRIGAAGRPAKLLRCPRCARRRCCRVEPNSTAQS